MKVKIPLGMGLYGVLKGKPIDIAATMYGSGYSIEQTRERIIRLIKSERKG